MREGWAGAHRMRNRGVDKQARAVSRQLKLRSHHFAEGHHTVQSHSHVDLMSCDSMIPRALTCKVPRTAW